MVQTIFVLLFLILFPFGQIIRFGIIHPIDVIVVLTALVAFFGNYKKPLIFNNINTFLITAIGSWVFSIAIFPEFKILYGFLYLIRFAAYCYFLIYLFNFAKNIKNRLLLLDSLLAVSVVSAIFGWIQYFRFPDIKPFFEWGWDQHLFRLVGTFLDPTYLGLIIVFGLIVSMNRYIDTKNKKFNLVISLFLLISLAFTYSRASYLAFMIGSLVLLKAKNKIGYILYPFVILVALILILPTSKNHSISFFRSFSAIARVQNYADTVEVVKFSPVFGVGFNNLCLAKQKVIGIEPFASHACSGSDSSLLLILATTGVIGFMIFVHQFFNSLNYIPDGESRNIFNSVISALFVHSLFSNSLFYSWVMGYVAILLAVVLNEVSTKKR